MAKFGDLLSELRRDKKLTQDELAHILFVTSGTISNYENNVHYPDVVKLIQLAIPFGNCFYLSCNNRLSAWPLHMRSVTSNYGAKDDERTNVESGTY